MQANKLLAFATKAATRLEPGSAVQDGAEGCPAIMTFSFETM